MNKAGWFIVALLLALILPKGIAMVGAFIIGYLTLGDDHNAK